MADGNRGGYRGRGDGATMAPPSRLGVPSGGWVSPAELLAWQAGRYRSRWTLAGWAVAAALVGFVAGLRVRHG